MAKTDLSLPPPEAWLGDSGISSLQIRKTQAQHFVVLQSRNSEQGPRESMTGDSRDHLQRQVNDLFTGAGWVRFSLHSAKFCAYQ